MASLEINVPDDLRERLCRVLGVDDGAVGEFALAVIRREVGRLESRINQEKHRSDAGAERQELSMAEWQIRRKNRPVLYIDFNAAQAIREDRERRTQQWDIYMESEGKNTS